MQRWLCLWLVAFSASAVYGQLTIPAEESFSSQGVVLSPGSGSDPDEYIGDVRADTQGHATPFGMLFANDEYNLYYGCSDGLRGDSGLAHRALCHATSPDGITWAKNLANEILSYTPNTDDEEGFYSGAFCIDGSTIYAFLGSMVGSGGEVKSNVRLYTAPTNDPDNLSFDSEVLTWDDSDVWGYGDELFSTHCWKDTNWHLYYIAKGGGVTWGMGHAEGASYSNWNDSGATEEVSDTSVEFRGGGSVVAINGSTGYACVQKKDGTDWRNEVSSFPTSDPSDLTLEETWDFDDDESIICYYDASSDAWYVYRVDTDADAVRLETYNTLALVSSSLSAATVSGGTIN